MKTRSIPLIFAALSWITPLAAAPQGSSQEGQSAKPAAAPSGALPTVAKATAGFERKKGLLNFHVDRQKGKIWLEVPPVPSKGGKGGEVGSFLYQEALLTGLGSNPVGLDRGQLGDTRVVILRRVGGRLLVEQPNLRFRALSEDPLERQTVRESFATSVLWAGEITAADPDGRALVDFTSFLVRDAHDIAARMKATGQGNWSLDAGRSVVDLESCLAFPENLEFEAILTYQSNEPGELVRRTAPTASTVTLVQHHSLLRLPNISEEGYKPRPFDPRSGSYAVDFLNYAAPLSAPIETRYLSRHRLEKVDPAAPALEGQEADRLLRRFRSARAGAEAP